MKHKGALIFFYTLFNDILNIFVTVTISINLKSLLELHGPNWEIGQAHLILLNLLNGQKRLPSLIQLTLYVSIIDGFVFSNVHHRVQSKNPRFAAFAKGLATSHSGFLNTFWKFGTENQVAEKSVCSEVFEASTGHRSWVADGFFAFFL